MSVAPLASAKASSLRSSKAVASTLASTRALCLMASFAAIMFLTNMLQSVPDFHLWPPFSASWMQLAATAMLMSASRKWLMLEFFLATFSMNLILLVSVEFTSLWLAEKLAHRLYSADNVGLPSSSKKRAILLDFGRMWTPLGGIDRLQRSFKCLSNSSWAMKSTRVEFLKTGPGANSFPPTMADHMGSELEESGFLFFSARIWGQASWAKETRSLHKASRERDSFSEGLSLSCSFPPADSGSMVPLVWVPSGCQGGPRLEPKSCSTSSSEISSNSEDGRPVAPGWERGVDRMESSPVLFLFKEGKDGWAVPRKGG